MSDQISIHAGGGMSIAGPKSMNLYRAIVLKQALGLYTKTGMLATRSCSATQMLNIATEYTGQKYKRGQHAQAAIDMAAWIAVAKAGANIVEAENDFPME